jgi:hypothetical protein
MTTKSLELYAKGLDPEYYWELVNPMDSLVKKWRVSFERQVSLYLLNEQSQSIQY